MVRSGGGGRALISVISHSRGRADPGVIDEWHAEAGGHLLDRDRSIRAAARRVRRSGLPGGGEQIAVIGKTVTVNHNRTEGIGLCPDGKEKSCEEQKDRR